MRKNSISQRLNIVKGQLDGLSKLIEENSDCKKVTAQFKAVSSAFKKIMEIYLKENLACCMKDMKLKQNKNAEFLLREIIESK
jgi:DNA-binding FrmR family transcriptional regulator